MDIPSAIHTLTDSANTLFLLIGAVMVLAIHAGFAFLEVGTVRHKNQVNALVKIMTDFGISAIAYFFIGYYIAYGNHFFSSATVLTENQGYELVKTLNGISGLVAVNSLMAMVGGTIVAMVVSRKDPGFIHNGPLAGLVAVCAVSDLMHPIGGLVIYGTVRQVAGLRLSQEEEFNGADVSIHNIGATSFE